MKIIVPDKFVEVVAEGHQAFLEGLGSGQCPYETKHPEYPYWFLGWWGPKNAQINSDAGVITSWIDCFVEAVETRDEARNLGRMIADDPDYDRMISSGPHTVGNAVFTVPPIETCIAEVRAYNDSLE